MQYLFILLLIVNFGSYAFAQEERQSNSRNRHNFPVPYRNTNQLKHSLNYMTEVLTARPELRIVIIYYNGIKGNKINFSTFKTKAEKILVKSNKISSDRFWIANGGSGRKDTNSFVIIIADKDGPL